MGTRAHLPIFLDDEEEKVLVCTTVLPPPSARKGKKSRVRPGLEVKRWVEVWGRNGSSHRQRRESDSWTEKHTDRNTKREFEEEPEEAGGPVGTGRRQVALLSERLTKLDSTVVVRAVRVPSSGRAGTRGRM